MRNILAIGSLLAVGAAASGAGALALKGSDTMEQLTNAVLGGPTDCGGVATGGSLTYAGTGSGNGEAALVAATQQIAPMSRPLKCSVTAANPSFKMNVVALDAVAIIESRREGTLGSPGSAVDATPVTDPTLKTCLGVKFSTGAPFDRIRAVFSGGDGTSATADGSAAQCQTTFRKSILGNWQNFTSSTCAKSGNPIRHAFRRDDKSGTTDTFKNVVGVSNFCNGAATGAIPGAGQNLDSDPIRRTGCRTTDPAPYNREQVCSSAGDNGVVLPITVPATSPYPGAGAPPDTDADRIARHDNGEFHRMHQSLTVATQPSPVTPCRRPDSTDQIGCLVAVNPYSIGFAGLEATTITGATYLKVGNVVPRTNTIQPLQTTSSLTPPAGAYPISRRLTVNDLNGNAAVTGDEAKLLACYLTPAEVDARAASFGFVSLDRTKPVVDPVCVP